ncbi:MAG: hypothetical protein AAF959_11095 [Cyanobacteria bacterium P01_D01_bin.56]
MADSKEIPDSTPSIPLSGAQWWLSHFTQLQLRIIASVSRQVLKPFRVTQESANKELKAEITALRKELEALRSENEAYKLELERKVNECVAYAKRLEMLFREAEAWKEKAAEISDTAKADIETLERTIERTNGIVDLIQFATHPLESIRSYLNGLKDRSDRLDARRSKSDGANIQGLVGRELDHPLRRKRDRD